MQVRIKIITTITPQKNPQHFSHSKLLSAKTFKYTTESVTKNIVHEFFTSLLFLHVSTQVNTLQTQHFLEITHFSTHIIICWCIQMKHSVPTGQFWSVCLQKGRAKYYQWKIRTWNWSYVDPAWPTALTWASLTYAATIWSHVTYLRVYLYNCFLFNCRPIDTF
jgi:hypothetical protein